MKYYRHERDIIRDIYRVVKPVGFVQKLDLKFVSGFPDIVVGSWCETAFFEVKRWGGKFSKIQVATLKEMRKHGMHAYGLVANDSDTVKLIDFETGKEVSGALPYIVLTAWKQL